MDVYIVTLTILGVVILFTAWLPMALRTVPLSLPIFCIILGAILAWSPFPVLPRFNPLDNRVLTERMTEFVVIIALMGAGLKLDRPLGWRRWIITWRLLGIAMPLTIAAIALLGWSMLGLGVASALLLGASLAPTDPVLASDVQVGPPQSGEEDEVRFALTSEAGLNDGLSFPFVYAAIAMAIASNDHSAWFQQWALVDVLWRLVAGIGVGWATGRILGYLTFRTPKETQLSRTGDGFVALGITFLAYGATELVHGYGFLAVFIAGLTLRSVERHNKFANRLHDFAEQIERLVMMILLVCFGAIVATGPLLAEVDWQIVVVALMVLFVVRPALAWLSLTGAGCPSGERAIISIFGIRGLGSVYYLAYASGKAEFEGIRTIWATVLLIILISIVVHGISVTPTMSWLDKRRSRQHERPTNESIQ